MKNYFLLICLGLAVLQVSAQPEAESTTIKILERSPAAPNTASLGKYFDVPVNLSTGVANIQIPLYTIKSGDITIPISISYHAGGNKVNTPASWVGLGWDLNCGGVITKQVNGLDDFYSTSHYNTINGHPSHSNYFNPDYDIDASLGFTSMTQVIDSLHSATYGPPHVIDLYKLIGRIILNYYDGESDEYHYSTPEDNGTIFYNQKTVSFQMDKINGWKNNFDISNNRWELTSNNGMHYSFGAAEETLSPVYAGNPDGEYYTSAWYLSGISDGVNARSVTISYDQSARILSGAGESRVENWEIGSGASFKSGNTTSSLRYGRELNVNTITFNEGRVEFIKDTATRVDGGVKALRKIKVFDNANVLKKQFNFDYLYVGNPSIYTARLYLKSVQEVNFLDSSITESKPYLIHYDTSVALPKRYSYAQDIWGFYNGKTSNSTVIPTEWATQIQGLPAFADRRVDSNYSRAGMIKQIVYPTGGSLNFVFESNQDYNDSLVGGVRIKRITNYDSVANKKLVTEYRYNDDSSHSTGALHYRPRFNYSLSMGAMLEPHVRVSGEPILPLFNNQGSPVTYSRVEKIEIADTVEMKTRHYFHNNLSGLGVPDPLTDEGSICVPYQKFPNLMRFSNLPYATEVYKRENGQFLPVKSESLGYTTLNQFKNSIWNVQAAWTAGFGIWVEDPGNDPYSNNMTFYPSINAYKLIQETVVNDVATNNTYQGSEILSQTTYKKYDTTNGNLKRITTVTSNGDTLRTYYSYVSDFIHTNSSDPINDEIDLLLDVNVLAAPIEIISIRKKPGGSEYVTDANLYLYKDKKLQKHLKINEKDLLLSSVTRAYNNSTAFYYDNRYEAESEVVSFNAAKNPSEMVLRNKTQSLLWDKDDVTANIINAGIASVAATSFESTEKGGWTYSGSTSNSYSMTGNKSYNLNGNNITKSDLASATYIVSYWGRSGSVNVNSAGPSVSGKVIGDWRYYEHEVTTTSITISGSNYIDELRLYPKGAMMSTYTYSPILGMTSQCDAANRINYFEYDGFGRLKLMRDEDGKVVKRMEYKFQATAQQ